ncbi:MAG TPA: LysR substrate-binding domain-containing protein, partial [Actinomycetales bacterium]
LTRLGSFVSDLREGRSGRLTIGYFASAGTAWMPRLAKSLVEEFPELVLELRMNELPDGSSGAQQPDIDLVVETDHTAEVVVPQGYRHQPLVLDPYVVIVHRDHPLALLDSVAVAALADETWVDNDAGNGPCRKVVVNACGAAGFSPRFAVQAQDHYTAIAFVAHGLGVTVVPRLTTVDLPATVRAVRLTDPEPSRQISFLVRESVLTSPVAARALERLTAFAAAAGDGAGSDGVRRASQAGTGSAATTLPRNGSSSSGNGSAWTTVSPVTARVSTT